MTPELIATITRELETALAAAGDFGSATLTVNKRAGRIDRLTVKSEKSILTGKEADHA